MYYSIKQNIGVNAITLQDGQKIYDEIFSELENQTVVTLDFQDVRIVASPFLNAAIGHLLKDFTPEDLNQYLKITNLSPIARPILKRVIDNAKEYYSSDAIREAVEHVLAVEASDSDAD